MREDSTSDILALESGELILHSREQYELLDYYIRRNERRVESTSSEGGIPVASHSLLQRDRAPLSSICHLLVWLDREHYEFASFW
jgi:hypothetical protein